MKLQKIGYLSIGATYAASCKKIVKGRSQKILEENGRLQMKEAVWRHPMSSGYGFAGAGAAEATATLALVVPIKPVRLSRTPRRK